MKLLIKEQKCRLILQHTEGKIVIQKSLINEKLFYALNITFAPLVFEEVIGCVGNFGILWKCVADPENCHVRSLAIQLWGVPMYIL